MTQEQPGGIFDSGGPIISDRINYPWILQEAIRNFHTSIVKPEELRSEQEILESSIALYESIPDPWKEEDEKFEAELLKAKVTLKYDMRPEWCGVTIGKEPIWKNVETFDPYKLYHACINLLHRRNLLTKTQWIEYMLSDQQVQELIEVETELQGELISDE